MDFMDFMEFPWIPGANKETKGYTGRQREAKWRQNENEGDKEARRQGDTA